MICTYCGKDHSWLYCRTKPEGWKPPKKSLHGGAGGYSVAGKTEAKSLDGLDSGFESHPVRTSAPVVESPPGLLHLGRPRMEGPSQGKSKRAAYMRDFQRERRAKLKALSGAAK